MKKTSKSKLPAPAESIARLADNGQDTSPYFTNKGKMMPPLDSVDLRLNEEMIAELMRRPVNLMLADKPSSNVSSGAASTSSIPHREPEKLVDADGAEATCRGLFAPRNTCRSSDKWSA